MPQHRLTNSKIPASRFRKHRHLRSSRVLCKDNGEPVTRQGAWSRVRYAAHRAKVPIDTIRLLETRAGDSDRGEILETGEGGDRKLKS